MERKLEAKNIQLTEEEKKQTEDKREGSIGGSLHLATSAKG